MSCFPDLIVGCLVVNMGIGHKMLESNNENVIGS